MHTQSTVGAYAPWGIIWSSKQRARCIGCLAPGTERRALSTLCRARCHLTQRQSVPTDLPTPSARVHKPVRPLFSQSQRSAPNDTMDAALLAALDKLTETLQTLQAGGDGAFALQLHPPAAPGSAAPSAISKAPALAMPQLPSSVAAPLQMSFSLGERGPVLSCAIAFGPGAQAACTLTSNGVEAKAHCGPPPPGRLTGPGKAWDGVVREAGRRTRRAFYKPEPESWSESESYVDSEDSAPKLEAQSWVQVQRTSLPSPPSSSSERTKIATATQATQVPAPNLPKEEEAPPQPPASVTSSKRGDPYDPQWWVKDRKAVLASSDTSVVRPVVSRPSTAQPSAGSESGSRPASPYNPHWWIKDQERKPEITAASPGSRDVIAQPQAVPHSQAVVQIRPSAQSSSGSESGSRPTSPYNPHWWVKNKSQPSQPGPVFRDSTSRPGSDSGSLPTSPYNPHWWVKEKRKRSDSTSEAAAPTPEAGHVAQPKIADFQPVAAPTAYSASESQPVPASPTSSVGSSQSLYDPHWWVKKRSITPRSPSPTGSRPTSPYDPHWWVKDKDSVKGVVQNSAPAQPISATVPSPVLPAAAQVRHEREPTGEPKPLGQVKPVQTEPVAADAVPSVPSRPQAVDDRKSGHLSASERKVKVRMRRGLPFFEDPRHTSALVDLEYPVAHPLPAHPEGCAICDRRAVRSALFPHAPPGCSKVAPRVGPKVISKLPKAPSQAAKSTAPAAVKAETAKAAMAAASAVKAPEAPKALKISGPTGGQLTPSGYIHVPLPRMAKKRMEFPAPIASDR